MKAILTAAAFAALLTGLVPAPARAQDSVFSDAQKKAIDAMIHDYLMNHPEAIMESVEKYRQESEASASRIFDEKIKTSSDALYKDPMSPVVGNKDGDVTLVEFFDYNCGYCKLAFKDIKTLIGEDKNLRVVFKEIPILSEASYMASRYALAAEKQGKYWEFHQELMRNGANNESMIERSAKDVGLDLDKLRKDADSPEIRAALEKNLALARDIGITGTPGFVIADKALRGHYGVDALRKTIADTRGSKRD